MNRPEEYRQQPEHCRLQAAKAVRDTDKAQWLKLAVERLSGLSARERNDDTDR